MAAYYFDSSALVKRYRTEVGTEKVAAILSVSGQFFTSKFSRLEVVAAITRQAKQVALEPARLKQIIDQFVQDLSMQFNVIDLSDAVLDQSVVLTNRYALRAGDALQLASAMIAARYSTDHLAFVASDAALNAAAIAEGFDVIDPMDP